MNRILSIVILCLLPLAASAQGLTAEGVVINAVDGNGLPLCVVQLKHDGAIKARAVTDYAGRYMLQSVVQGVYDIVVVQFGDTLCRYRGLTLERNTLIRHYVQPPAGVESEPTIDYALGVRLLRPATVSVRVKNMLGQMGLLITDPNDPRLWNYSGQLLAGPANEDISWPGPGGRNPFLASLTLVCPGLEPSWKNCDMKNELLIYGRILDYEASSDTTGKKRD